MRFILNFFNIFRRNEQVACKMVLFWVNLIYDIFPITITLLKRAVLLWCLYIFCILCGILNYKRGTILMVEKLFFYYSQNLHFFYYFRIFIESFSIPIILCVYSTTSLKWLIEFQLTLFYHIFAFTHAMMKWFSHFSHVNDVKKIYWCIKYKC